MGDDTAREQSNTLYGEESVHYPPRCPRFVDKRGRPWQIAPYRPTHREELLAMYRDFEPAERAQGVPPFAEQRIEQWLGQLLDEGCNFVAESDGTVAGHALYTPSGADEPELAVFVHQTYQGRGLGTELCRHVVAAASAADRDALVLDVKPSNRTAMGIYERLGFERVDHGADGPGRQGHAVRMRLSLPPTATEQGQQVRALGD